MSTIKASRQPVHCHTTTSSFSLHKAKLDLNIECIGHTLYTLYLQTVLVLFILKRHLNILTIHVDVVWPFLFGSCSSRFLWTAKSFRRDKPIERPLHGQMQLWSNRTCHWSSEASFYGRVFNEHNRLLGHWSACKQRSRRDSVPAYQLHSHVNSHAQSVKKAIIIIEESRIQSTLQLFKSFCQKR